MNSAAVTCLATTALATLFFMKKKVVLVALRGKKASAIAVVTNVVRSIEAVPHRNANPAAGPLPASLISIDASGRQ